MAKKPAKLKISNAWKGPYSTLVSAALGALILKSQGLSWESAGIAAGITALGGVLPDPKMLQKQDK
jgi:hypothetical protein